MDVLVYSKNYVPQTDKAQPEYWHSNATVFGQLGAGDRLWVVTSGKSINREPEHAGFLVAVWSVENVMQNPGDNVEFRKDKFAYRVVMDAAESISLDDPVNVDSLLRPTGGKEDSPIGRFLRMPRRLNDQQVRQLRTTAGHELALKWLKGNR